MKISSFLYKSMYHLSPLFPDKLYLKLQFKHLMHYKLDLDHPKTFQEKLQWLKLYDRKPIYTKMVDKYDAKEFIKEKVGEQYVIPTIGIYNNVDEIDWINLPDSFVMKTTHDSGTVIVCNDKTKLDVDKSKKYLRKRLKRDYFYTEREWPYKNVKPRIIVEKNISIGDELSDYKFFCFNGKVKYLYISSNRGKEGGLREDFYDENGNHCEVIQTGYPNNDVHPSLPINFEKMKELAEILADNIPQLRVDFYEIAEKIYVGELTFSDGGGFAAFYPDIYNKLLGDLIKLPTDK